MARWVLTGLGNFDRFPPTSPRVGCRFGLRTFVGVQGNGQDAPEADIVAKPVAGQNMANVLRGGSQPLPAVNMYRLAREKTCVMRGEKCDDRGDLVGLPDPTQDVAFDHGV